MAPKQMYVQGLRYSVPDFVMNQTGGLQLPYK